MNIWGELDHLCKGIRVKSDKMGSLVLSRPQLRELERILGLLPADDISLVGAEGAAIYHEFVGNIPEAILAWQTLLERIEFLRNDLEENDYCESVRITVLGRCDDDTIQRCIAAIQRLKTLLDKGPDEGTAK